VGAARSAAGGWGRSTDGRGKARRALDLLSRAPALVGAHAACARSAHRRSRVAREEVALRASAHAAPHAAGGAVADAPGRAWAAARHRVIDARIRHASRQGSGAFGRWWAIGRRCALEAPCSDLPADAYRGRGCASGRAHGGVARIRTAVRPFGGIERVAMSVVDRGVRRCLVRLAPRVTHVFPG